MSAIFVWLKPCLTDIERLLPAKSQKFSTVLGVFLDQSASCNQAKCNVGHINDLFQLKCLRFFHGHERNICLIEAMFDWHWALSTGENVTSSTLQNKLFEIRAQVLIKQNVFSGIQITHFRWNIFNFSTDMSAIFGWLKPCLTSIERWQPAKMSQAQRCKTSSALY